MGASMASLFAFLTFQLCHNNTNVGPTHAHLHLIAAKFYLQGQQRVNMLPFAQSVEGAQRDATRKTQQCISKVWGWASRLPQIAEMRVLLCHVHAALLLAADSKGQIYILWL